jgi:hypothetical protein
MKKIILFISIMAFGLMTHASMVTETTTPSTLSKFIFVFSSRAHWDGTTQSCLPQEKGWCLHIGFKSIILDGQIIGEGTYSTSTGLIFSFNQQTGVSRKTFDELFKNGKFFLDGPGTLSDEIIRMLRLPTNYSIPAGNYPYSVDGEMVHITFK